MTYIHLLLSYAQGQQAKHGKKAELPFAGLDSLKQSDQELRASNSSSAQEA